MVKKYYSYKAVDNYIASLDENVTALCITGSLVDNWIIDHGHCIEIFREVYENMYSSLLARHIYRKRVPQKMLNWLNDEYDYYMNEWEKNGKREEDENGYIACDILAMIDTIHDFN